jgi:hypothetical protein
VRFQLLLKMAMLVIVGLLLQQPLPAATDCCSSGLCEVPEQCGTGCLPLETNICCDGFDITCVDGSCPLWQINGFC